MIEVWDLDPDYTDTWYEFYLNHAHHRTYERCMDGKTNQVRIGTGDSGPRASAAKRMEGSSSMVTGI